MKFPIERKPQMSPVPGGELFECHRHLFSEGFHTVVATFDPMKKQAGLIGEEGETTPLLEQEGWPKAGVVVRLKWFSPRFLRSFVSDYVLTRSIIHIPPSPKIRFGNQAATIGESRLMSPSLPNSSNVDQ